MIKKVTVGERFSRLIVIETFRDTMPRARCRCDCGAEVIVRPGNLRSGNTNSCGCYKRERTSLRRATHKKAGSKIYKIWAGILQRCTNPKNNSFKNYGGRGISVCTKWRTFQGFYESMGDPPSVNHSIERI